VTPPAADDSHLSIGEVLAELRDEFPDITISKIRFLESQGLVNPERTPSGYRKFYDADLVRLRWILHQQKEHFLPLKVIKERLDALPPGGEAVLLDPAPATPVGDAAPGSTSEAPPVTAPPADAASPAPPAAPARSAAFPPGRVAPGPAAAAPRRAPVRRRTPAFAPDLPADAGGDDALVAEHSGDGYTRADLARDAGLEPAQVAELESYGLIAPVRESGGDAEFDADALEIAKVAAGFFSRGVEARHLRMYRNAAEREAALFGQVLMPFVRQRNPEARARMQEELVELSALGRRLRLALLREAVRDSLAE
jgi:DNA-binding transcriptional MerR regulator